VTTQPSVTLSTGGATVVWPQVPQDNGSGQTSSSLAFTGSNSITAASAAMCLLLVGLAFTLIGRRTRLRKH
jgi:hypothetical protein